jgi:hypothetical protein
VEKWTLNATQSIVVMNVGYPCYGLFVDIADYLYCSLYNEHRVMKQSLNLTKNNLITVAGTGSYGSASNMLNGPIGIFVSIHFDLYVADCENNRVQHFKPGELNGTTEPEKSATLSLELKCPSAVFLDAAGYLFIAEFGNNRIVGSGPNGFFCLAGCSGDHGVAPNQLWSPVAAAFDSYGNFFVADSWNNRIQKFVRITDTFGK